MASTSTTSAYESGRGGGGAGGKFRKRPTRAPSTPYTRPPNNSTTKRSIYQFTKDFLVQNVKDPASQFIFKTAKNLFASLSNKRIAPHQANGAEAPREEREESQQANVIRMQTADPGSQVRVSSEQEIPSNGQSSKGINEIEEVLMKKSFTRAEVDRLTQLLQSKTVNAPADDNRRRPEPTTSRIEATHEYQRHADKVEYQRSFGDTQVTTVNSNVFKSEVTSAADLAKAYMVSAPMNISPSNLGLHSQPFRSDVPLLANLPYTPKSSGALFSPNSATDFSENGYTTRRTRGRSAIYNMARTPNSRTHDTAIRKIDGYIASSSQWSRENNTVSNGKQATKRRSSILDGDIGSIGPIRRVRQKTDMMSPPRNPHTLSIRGPPLAGKVDGFDIARDPRLVRQKQMFLNGPMDSTSNTHLAENGDMDSSSVPSRSSKIAERILQQLEKSVPSPKEKLSELKLVVAREKSPTKLTHKMLNGKALRSLEDIDSSKLLKDVASNGKQAREARASTSYNPDEFDNGKSAPKENGEVKAWKENVATVKISDAAVSSLAVRHSEKKQAFRMSAHEDFLELDDDSDSEGARPISVKGKLDKSSVDSKEVAVKPSTAENNSSETKSPTSFAVKETKLSKSSVMKEDTDTKVDTASTTAEKNANFTFPVTPASSTSAQLTSPTPQPSMFPNGVSPPKETPSAQIVNIASKSVEKPGPFKFSGQSDSPFDTKSEPKLTETSTANAAVSVSDTDTPQVPKSEGHDKSQKSQDLFGRPESCIPSTASTSAATTTNIFLSEPPKMNNGPFSFQPISTTAQVSTGISNAIFSAATTTTTTTDATITTTTTTDAATTNPSPAFTPFGSKSIVAPLEQPEDKPASPSPFGNTSFTFGDSPSPSSSAFAFGFSASSTASTTSNLLSSSTSPSPFGTSTGASTAPNPFGTSTGLSSAPNPFGTPTKTEAASVNIFGTSTSTGSLFGSTKTDAAPVNPFGTSSTAPLFNSIKSEAAPVTTSFPTFGQTTSSSSLSSGTPIFGSTPTPTPTPTPTTSNPIFGSSSGFGSSSSTTPSPFGSGFGSTTSTSVFAFGAPPATSAPAPSTPIFGSSTTKPAFSFTPLAPTTTTTPQFGTPTPVFSSFGATPNNQMTMEDSMAEDAMQSSSPVATFGQPNPTPPGNFGFGGAPPFQFGGQQNNNLGGGAPPPQNSAPFQATGNLELPAGSSFSLGATGDKANRRTFKAKRHGKR